jgi:hypothetical protein
MVKATLSIKNGVEIDKFTKLESIFEKKIKIEDIEVMSP